LEIAADSAVRFAGLRLTLEEAMIDRRKLIALGICTVAGTVIAGGSKVNAGEFFEKEGVAIRGYDPVAYFKDNMPVKGSPAIEATYKGSRFLFASDANRALFVADPDRYAPQFGGYCAFGTARGYKAAIDPAAFTIVDGKLYLNYNPDVQQEWRADVAGFVAKANANWPEVSKQTRVAE
jgi:YHS domain-containing protein